MNLSPLVTDNISEVLDKIIKFTKIRQKILTENISNVDNKDYLPKDLTVDEFSSLLDNAIDEHVQNKRLLLRDTTNVNFGTDGKFDVKPVMDKLAKKLLKENKDEYLELQLSKFMENTLNQKLASELLKQKAETVKTFD